MRLKADRGHPEVVATLGQYSNASKGIYLIENISDIENLQIRDENNLSYVTQTTLSIDESKKIIDALRNRYPNIQGPRKDDICYATQARQNAVSTLAEKVDLFIVVGSVNSSNSNRLRELASSHGCTAYLVDDAEQIRDEWFSDSVVNIGVTAGASAPDVLIEQVVERNAIMADYRTAKVHIHHFVEYIARLIEILLKCMREIAIQRQTQQTLHQVRCIYNITVSGYFMYIADFVPSILQSKISVGRIEEVEFIYINSFSHNVVHSLFSEIT